MKFAFPAVAVCVAVLFRLLLRFQADGLHIRAFVSERERSAFEASDDVAVLPSRTQPPFGWLTAYALLYAQRPAKVVSLGGHVDS